MPKYRIDGTYYLIHDKNTSRERTEVRHVHETLEATTSYEAMETVVASHHQATWTNISATKLEN